MKKRLALWMARKVGRCLTKECTCPCHVPPKWYSGGYVKVIK